MLRYGAATISRRRFLAGIGGSAAVAMVAPGMFRRAGDALEAEDEDALSAASVPEPDLDGWLAPPLVRRAEGPHHLAWVWRFAEDGPPEVIRDTLAAHRLGISLKTHNDTRWMARWDKSDTAIRGPRTIEAYASFFENAGVPFHAWTVVKGLDPKREARLASQVLDAGARSLFLDLESYDRFWEGTREDALIFGEELRRLQPSAHIATSIDPRPWELDKIPLGEFAAFSDELAPQLYWSLFTSRTNVRMYTQAGDAVGTDGVTPRFVVASAAQRLAAYGLPIHPIGDGTAMVADGWLDFLEEAYGWEMDAVSVWRYGIADPQIWSLLQGMPPRGALIA